MDTEWQELEGPNALVNPSFEGVYVQDPDYFSNFIAPGWSPFYCDGCPSPHAGEPGINDVMVAPELKRECLPQFDNRVLDGQCAQVIFRPYHNFDSGVYQTITTEPGKEYVVRVYGHVWSRHDGNDPFNSNALDNLGQYIAIGLNGETTPFGLTTVRSDDYYYHDTYRQLELRFTASGTRTSIFFGAANEYPVGINNAYFDKAEVRQIFRIPVVSEVTTTPSPFTPIPSATPYVTSTPTVPPPTTFPTPTSIAVGVDQLCGAWGGIVVPSDVFFTPSYPSIQVAADPFRTSFTGVLYDTDTVPVLKSYTQALPDGTVRSDYCVYHIRNGVEILGWVRGDYGVADCASDAVCP